MVYGSTILFAKYNFFVATGLLASAGISVEFTSHLIASFTSVDGPLPERLGTAMAMTSPALIQGAVSTFLSMLPLAFNPIAFVVKYFFGMFAVLVAVGLLIGLRLRQGRVQGANCPLSCSRRRMMQQRHPPLNSIPHLCPSEFLP